MTDKKDKYEQFRNLSPGERRNLLWTNFFYLKHNLPLIEVPDEEIHYHINFAKMIKNNK